MSQENVESFKRGVEAYNRRDAQALIEELDPTVEWIKIGRETGVRWRRVDHSVFTEP
jgi:hypothetical protein